MGLVEGLSITSLAGAFPHRIDPVPLEKVAVDTCPQWEECGRKLGEVKVWQQDRAALKCIQLRRRDLLFCVSAGRVAVWPHPGGQGVAGSNPVVPTVWISPLVLGEAQVSGVFRVLETISA
ncbi:hypothetical protein V1227_16635 [Lentzea sp. DG1S-22]|uniref:hypothetical protein n=1 Tax=Lentzea sp. DG1S-22 TaxID=3108822 RepID=UPI002E783C33|nr:hypothetical protein [Lentzea sp. DG1S-22]WVH84302.1 hypothetical protein V1227_16635 [Lentzea sp. DG1S-22]